MSTSSVLCVCILTMAQKRMKKQMMTSIGVTSFHARDVRATRTSKRITVDASHHS